MRPYLSFTDDELIEEIGALFAAKRKVATGDIAVIAGEGRRVEYSPGNISALAESLRHAEYEARQRGLPIGGIGGAVDVRFEP